MKAKWVSSDKQSREAGGLRELINMSAKSNCSTDTAIVKIIKLLWQACRVLPRSRVCLACQQSFHRCQRWQQLNWRQPNKLHVQRATRCLISDAAKRWQTTNDARICTQQPGLARGHGKRLKQFQERLDLVIALINLCMQQELATFAASQTQHLPALVAACQRLQLLLPPQTFSFRALL